MTFLTTLDEAKAIATALGSIGGGVTEVYIPEYTTGPFPTPRDGERLFHHFRFQNGASGMNAGAVKWTMQSCPGRWPLMLAEEVEREANKPRWPWEVPA